MIRRFTAWRETATETHRADTFNPPDEPQYEGVVFSDGSCTIRWCTECASTSVWDDFETAMKVHGHLPAHFDAALYSRRIQQQHP